MNVVAIGQFIRGNSVLIIVLVGALVTVGSSVLIYLNQKAKRLKRAQQGLATCWMATLAELSSSLNGMQTVTHRLIRNRQRPGTNGNIYRSEIMLHRWLSEGFMLMAMTTGQDCQVLVKSMQKDLTLFNWNINQATNARLRGHGVMLANQVNRDKLQIVVDVFDNAAIRLACNRHEGMVSMWNQSDQLLSRYCQMNNLARGIDLESPGSIPLNWQMDETEPWMIKNLAQVGDETW